MNGNGAAVDFNPRSPRGERQGFAVEFLLDDISIHAPLAGSDGVAGKLPDYDGDFNPRSPRGERLFCDKGAAAGTGISIHAPLAGSDSETAQRHRYVL